MCSWGCLVLRLVIAVAYISLLFIGLHNFLVGFVVALCLVLCLVCLCLCGGLFMAFVVGCIWHCKVS